MTEHVLIALIAAAGAIAAAAISAAALVATRQTHSLINSRMDELLAEARLIAHAEGVKQAEDEQLVRDAERHVRELPRPKGT